ncbi:MAG: ABC transporter substrate-binding protein [Spirochaetaceae bacterium]|nr:MAG: ABC transporter substrate-binding protein [Spirochaetaceae bacterium]
MKRTILLLLVLALVVGSASLIIATPQVEETGPIKVGMYADLSAGTAQWGTDSEKGARLRIKEVNAAGGIMGRQVELVIYDCKVSPTEAVKTYTRLATQDKVAAVYGSLISNTALAVSPVAAQSKVPVVARAMDERATTPGFNPDNPEAPIAPNPYFFLLQPSCFQQAAVIGGYAIDVLGMDTFTMLYDKGNAYAEYLAKGFSYYVKKRGKQMLGTFEFQSGDVDYKAQLTRIKELGADGLFIPNYVTQNANAVKQARELGLQTTFLGNNSWYKPMDEVAGAAADGAYFPNNIAFDDPSLQWYFQKYQAEYGEEPRLHSFSGWDDMGFILQAIEKAGSTDPDKVRDAMEGTRKFEGIIGTINIDPKTHRPVGLPMSVLYFTGDQIKTAELKYTPKSP